MICTELEQSRVQQQYAYRRSNHNRSPYLRGTKYIATTSEYWYSGIYEEVSYTDRRFCSSHMPYNLMLLRTSRYMIALQHKYQYSILKRRAAWSRVLYVLVLIVILIDRQ